MIVWVLAALVAAKRARRVDAVERALTMMHEVEVARAARRIARVMAGADARKTPSGFVWGDSEIQGAVEAKREKARRRRSREERRR